MTLEIEQGMTQVNLTRALQAERTANDRLARTEKAEAQAQPALGQSLVSEGAAFAAHGADRPAVREPGAARPGRADPGSRPRGSQAAA